MSTVYYEEHDPSLRRDLDRLQVDVDGLMRKKLPALTEKVEAVRTRIQDLESRADHAETELLVHDESLEELSRTVRELKTSVQWIERYIRNSGTVEVVDLDAIDDRLRRAARRAEEGKAAKAKRLPDWQRTEHHGSIGRHEAAVGRAAKSDEGLLDAAAALTEMDWSDDTHAAARARYRCAKTEWSSANSQAHLFAARAAEARKDLAADDARRASDAAVIRDGEQAWAQLTAALRTTIAEAVSHGKLLPTWLHKRYWHIALRTTFRIRCMHWGPSPEVSAATRRTGLRRSKPQSAN